MINDQGIIILHIVSEHWSILNLMNLPEISEFNYAYVF